MFNLVLGKADEPEIKLPTSSGSWKKQESSRKTSISALLTMPKPLTVWITINWKILQEMGIPDHLICLLRNLYAGQEATVRTGHGTTDWFQIGKGVGQGCILSPCLFNLYAEYIILLWFWLFYCMFHYFFLCNSPDYWNFLLVTFLNILTHYKLNTERETDKHLQTHWNFHWPYTKCID